MQIFIFLRNASLYKEFFLAHVNFFFKKVSLYHYSSLLSLLCSDNQHVCCSDTLPYTPCNVSSMYHDFEVKYHDFGLSIVKIMLFSSLPLSSAFRWQIISHRLQIGSHPSVRMESTGWATDAHSLGTHCP